MTDTPPVSGGSRLTGKQTRLLLHVADSPGDDTASIGYVTRLDYDAANAGLRALEKRGFVRRERRVEFGIRRSFWLATTAGETAVMDVG